MVTARSTNGVAMGIDLDKTWNDPATEPVDEPDVDKGSNETLDTAAHPGTDAAAIAVDGRPELAGDPTDDDPYAILSDLRDDWDDPGLILEPETIARIAQQVAALLHSKPRTYLHGVRSTVGTSIPVQVLMPDPRRRGSVLLTTSQSIRLASDPATLYGGAELPALSTPLVIADGVTDGLWAIAVSSTATVDLWVVTE